MSLEGAARLGIALGLVRVSVDLEGKDDLLATSTKHLVNRQPLRLPRKHCRTGSAPSQAGYINRASALVIGLLTKCSRNGQRSRLCASEIPSTSAITLKLGREVSHSAVWIAYQQSALEFCLDGDIILSTNPPGHSHRRS